MVGTLVQQLSNGAPPKEWLEMKSAEYYADNGASVFPQNAQGTPFNAASIAVTGDPLTNLYEDLAAEQKARAVYDNILRLSDDPDVNEVIKFLRQREVVHFQRFGELQRPTLNEIIRYTATLESLSFFISYIGVAKNVNILPTLILKNEKQIYQIHFSL